MKNRVRLLENKATMSPMFIHTQEYRARVRNSDGRATDTLPAIQEILDDDDDESDGDQGRTKQRNEASIHVCVTYGKEEFG